ncbi:MAG: O-acetylserine dependent cystathionine beta-synthase [Candidatus Marinimicrobia bacterium]|nr:O-acetylserine dependent cystathionine beta-synthase [Candidatus Neomarinimicrobiota bacterium]
MIDKVESVWDAVGNTPLIRIKSLSEITGCSIYGKAEFLNPGGSIKDRAAKGIIKEGEESGDLQPGGTIVEGTAGNTGTGLATLAAERGYNVIISVPETQSDEKFQTLEALGAEIRKIGSYSFDDERHYYHQGRIIAGEIEGGFWADQFNNLANYRVHYETTGTEIWEQTEHEIDILTLAAGTGGTIAGVSNYLKEQDENVSVVLADPQGSGLLSYFRTGEMHGEGSSVTEGIGITRLTSNFEKARIDSGMRVTDQNMIDRLYHIARYDGLLIGTSSAVNLYTAYRLGIDNRNSGKTIVTFICDHGSRYQSRIFNPRWLEEQNLTPQPLDS